MIKVSLSIYYDGETLRVSDWGCDCCKDAPPVVKYGKNEIPVSLPELPEDAFPQEKEKYLYELLRAIASLVEPLDEVFEWTGYCGVYEIFIELDKGKITGEFQPNINQKVLGKVLERIGSMLQERT
ncbi:MAG: hypothetical protein QXI19_10900, partial [Candidatus Caldarchaeum sp.]